jgi:hypothetical protein
MQRTEKEKLQHVALQHDPQADLATGAPALAGIARRSRMMKTAGIWGSNRSARRTGPLLLLVGSGVSLNQTG